MTKTYIVVTPRYWSHSLVPNELIESGVVGLFRVAGGRYKWMVWAADDVVWFPQGLMKLLGSWDHALPHAISGIRQPESPVR